MRDQKRDESYVTEMCQILVSCPTRAYPVTEVKEIIRHIKIWIPDSQCGRIYKTKIPNVPPSCPPHHTRETPVAWGGREEDSTVQAGARGRESKRGLSSSQAALPFTQRTFLQDILLIQLLCSQPSTELIPMPQRQTNALREYRKEERRKGKLKRLSYLLYVK